MIMEELCSRIGTYRNIARLVSNPFGDPIHELEAWRTRGVKAVAARWTRRDGDGGASSTVINFSVLAQSFVEQSFKNYDIVPNVISAAPKYEATVFYRSGVRVNLGNELTPTQVKDIPVVFYNAAPDTFYTLAFVDPDVPSRAQPILGQWNHWLVVNIPGSYIAAGETLAEFVGSAPAIGTGAHRYVFLVYQQPDLLTFDEPRLNNTSTYNRNMFSIRLFAEKYDFGNPIAGNFYQAQYDDYVPKIRAQLGEK